MGEWHNDNHAGLCAQIRDLSAQLAQAHDEIERLTEVVRDLDETNDERRAMLDLAAERDSALCCQIADLTEAAMLARDALDSHMGDTDLDGDGSLEHQAMRALSEVLDD